MNVVPYLEIEIPKFHYVQIVFQMKFIFVNCLFKKSYIIFTHKNSCSYEIIKTFTCTSIYFLQN